MLFVHSRRAFTLVEVLLVVGLVGVLAAILIPALFAAQGQGTRALSYNNLKQAGEWITQYSLDNKQYIVPSQFDYNGAPFEGKVRSNSSEVGLDDNSGYWTDILWTLYSGQSLPDAVGAGLSHDYSVDSPDDAYYRLNEDFDGNPFRSAELNQKGTNRALPGYFAANNFFNADAGDATFNGWWTIGQIKDPARSLYAIDSFDDNSDANEVIEDDYGYWGKNSSRLEVDYRYVGEALILFLDGHVRGESEIDGDQTNDLDILENERKVKVRNLHR